MSYFSQNEIKVDCAQNNSNEGYHRRISLETVAVEPKPMHPHCFKSGFHQIIDWIALETEDEV